MSSTSSGALNIVESQRPNLREQFAELGLSEEIVNSVAERFEFYLSQLNKLPGASFTSIHEISTTRLHEWNLNELRMAAKLRLQLEDEIFSSDAALSNRTARVARALAPFQFLRTFLTAAHSMLESAPTLNIALREMIKNELRRNFVDIGVMSQSESMTFLNHIMRSIVTEFELNPEVHRMGNLISIVSLENQISHQRILQRLETISEEQLLFQFGDKFKFILRAGSADLDKLRTLPALYQFYERRMLKKAVIGTLGACDQCGTYLGDGRMRVVLTAQNNSILREDLKKVFEKTSAIVVEFSSGTTQEKDWQQGSKFKHEDSELEVTAVRSINNFAEVSVEFAGDQVKINHNIVGTWAMANLRSS